MTCWIVIPVKAPAECKTRLRDVLDDAARARLVTDMLARVIDAAHRVGGDSRLALLGPMRSDLPSGMIQLPDPGLGFNPALASARDCALAAGATRILFLSADLPHVGAEDVAAMMAVPGIAIAPDRDGTGTNALSLPLPDSAGFALSYGEGSLAAHRAEAARLELALTIVDRPGLAFDVDRPADLAVLGRG